MNPLISFLSLFDFLMDCDDLKINKFILIFLLPFILPLKSQINNKKKCYSDKKIKFI